MCYNNGCGMQNYCGNGCYNNGCGGFGGYGYGSWLWITLIFHLYLVLGCCGPRGTPKGAAGDDPGPPLLFTAGQAE